MTRSKLIKERIAWHAEQSNKRASEMQAADWEQKEHAKMIKHLQTALEETKARRWPLAAMIALGAVTFAQFGFAFWLCHGGQVLGGASLVVCSFSSCILGFSLWDFGKASAYREIGGEV